MIKLGKIRIGYKDFTDDERKREFVFNKVLRQRANVDYCLICGREIRPQKITVFKGNKKGIRAKGDYTCVCQLYQFLKNNNMVLINDKDWDWKTELEGSSHDSKVYRRINDWVKRHRTKK